MMHKPRTIGFREAAALPLVCMTAWEGLIDGDGVQLAQTILVHATTGGIGHIANQLTSI